MLLNSWPAEAALFDGDIMAGPVPSLYGEDPDASLAGITAEPRKAHWDLMKICRLHARDPGPRGRAVIHQEAKVNNSSLH